MNGVVQRKLEAIFSVLKAKEAHWCEEITAMEVTHAAKRRTALEKLKETHQNETLQRACATRAGKVSAVLQERMKEATTEKDRLTARCEELALENQCVSGLAHKVKKARELRVEVQRTFNGGAERE